MSKSPRLHYHEYPDRGSAPHWRDIPPGTWVKDRAYFARRALDEHIYDIVVDHKGCIYFWEDGVDWYLVRHASGLSVEEAKAVAAVLHRMGFNEKESP